MPDSNVLERVGTSLDGLEVYIDKTRRLVQANKYPKSCECTRWISEERARAPTLDMISL